jgi:GNAT superfamily N-acetyltransferase
VVKVDFLKHQPQHLPTVAHWIYDEWTHVSCPDLDTQIMTTRSSLNDDRIPLCLVAVEGTRCVGTISIFDDDLHQRPDLTPWLAALYVAPSHRNRGIGGILHAHLLRVARGLGIQRLYLHTETAAEYYRRKGWRFLFRTMNDRDEETDVFDLDVSVADGSADSEATGRPV